MNGYPTDFGMTECINVCASDKFSDKRVAYLGLMILVDETQSILMLMTNSLKQDLNSNHLQIVALALTVLSNTATTEMMRDLLPDVMGLVESGDFYIRRKAVMAAVRACRKLAADETGEFVGYLTELFEGGGASVRIVTTALIEVMCSQPLIEREQLRDIALPLLSHSAFVGGDFSGDGGRGDGRSGSSSKLETPFQQVKTLMAWRKLLITVGPTQDQLQDILRYVTEILRHVPATKVLDCSVLYEAIRTVIAFPSPPSEIMTLVINTLGTFMKHKDASVRFLSLELFAKLPTYTLPAIRKHLPTIVACLDEPDPTMRRGAVNLAHILADETNVAALTERLIEHVGILTDPDDVADACEKIVDMVERHAVHGPGGPQQADIWQVDVFAQLLAVADNNMPEMLVGYFLAKLSSFSEEAQARAAQCFYSTAFIEDRQRMENGEQKRKKKGPKKRLRRVACYVYGEYGNESIDSQEVVSCFDNVLTSTINLRGSSDEDVELRLAVLTALAKLVARSDGGDSSRRKPVSEKGTDVENDLFSDMGLLKITGGKASTAAPSQELSLVPTSLDVVKQATVDTSGDLTVYVKQVIAKWCDCSDLETQQRACEYFHLLESDSKDLLQSTLSKMPPMDYKAIKRKAHAATEGTSLQLMSSADDLLLLDVEPTKSNQLQITSGKSQLNSNGQNELAMISTDASLAELPAVEDNDFFRGLNDSPTDKPQQNRERANGEASDLDDMLGISVESNVGQGTKADAFGTLGSDKKDSNEQIKGAEDELLALGASYSAEENGKKTAGVASSQEENSEDKGAEQLGEAVLFESSAIKVSMRFLREDQSNPGHICGMATFLNLSSETLSKFTLKLSSKKHIKLQLLPASTRTLMPYGSANQTIYFTNTRHGSEPIEMMYRIEYLTPDGNEVREQGLAKNLPEMT